MKTISVAILFAVMTSLFTSCSMLSTGDGGQVQAPPVPLSCIAVLPATTSVGDDEKISYENARMLEEGALYADSVIRDKLAGNSEVRLLSRNQVLNLVPEVEGGLSATVAMIGQKVNCDGVLITTVKRFKQREGSEFASDSPASTEFKMVLRHTQNGAVLWSTEYRETQDSFLANIFSYEKMQSRGFKWVSVEQLMEQAISQRLGECPYL